MKIKSRYRGVNSKNKQILPLKPGMLHSQAIKINTHQGLPIWHLLKNYINKLDTNFEFNRYDLLSSVYTNEVVEGGMTACQTTADQYKRYLIISKVLESIGWGEYKKLKNIPKNLSINKLRNHVYGYNWKSWFIQLEDL